MNPPKSTHPLSNKEIDLIQDTLSFHSKLIAGIVHAIKLLEPQDLSLPINAPLNVERRFTVSHRAAGGTVLDIRFGDIPKVSLTSTLFCDDQADSSNRKATVLTTHQEFTLTGFPTETSEAILIDILYDMGHIAPSIHRETLVSNKVLKRLAALRRKRKP